MSTDEDKIKKKHLIKYANDAYERRDFEEAANTFSELIKVSGQKNVEWFIKRCDCYQHLNLDAEAMHDADTVVKMHPDSYKGYSLRGALHQIQGHYDEALFCYFDCLEIIWLSETNIKLPEVADKCLDDIIRSAQPVAELPDDIKEQDTMAQLYILGNSLRHEVQHTLAIRSMEVALIVCERSENVDENLKMKIYFVLGQSQQGTEKYDEAVESFKSSLSLALRVSDISYETKAYLNLSSLCLDQDRHSEAASYFIRLLAVGQDVLSAVGGDEEKFREHWSIEMEASILLNLCISFKWMRMYDEAIKFAERYDKIITRINTTPSSTPGAILQENVDEFRPKTVPTLGFSDTFSNQRSLDVSGMLQSKFILGDLHELRGDLDGAMKYYVEWLKMSEALSQESEGLENTYLLDTASALSCQGSVWLKKENYAAALECFKKQTLLAKKTKVPQLMMESALSRGDALIGLRRTDEARKAYEHAQKLSRSMDDLDPECMCMWKIASVFAAENRFTHAAYYCEQAVALASKCDKKSVQMKLKYELALYYQHSTSEKELRRAAATLYETITFQEKHISTHRRNGAKYFHDEEEMLKKCYTAIQVIFHKLGELELSAAFAEAWRMRKCTLLQKRSPGIPDISNFQDQDLKREAAAVEEAMDMDSVVIMKPQHFLPNNVEGVVMTFSLCAEGFLIQAIGQRVEQSYLSSKFDVKPYETRPKIESLVAKLGKVASRDQEATHFCNIYNCEPRNLPFDHQRPKIPLPKFKKHLSDLNPASGDSVRLEKPISESCVEYGGGEGTSPDLLKSLSVLEELYVILIEPMEEFLSGLKPGSDVTIVPDDVLKQVPFDCLMSPQTKKLLGERFNITLSPCTSFLKPSLSCERQGTVYKDYPTTAKTKITSSARPATASSSRKQSLKLPRPKSSSQRSPRRSANTSALDKEIQNFRRNELMKSYSNEADVEALEIGGFVSDISKLALSTATGTNILSSPRYPPPYKQVAKKQKCSVVGCPSLPHSLHYRGRIWHPASKLPMALKESKKVAKYFDVIAAVGPESTKRKFSEELRTTTVLHIATFADIGEGLLAFSPDDFPSQEGVVSEDSYLFGPEDLHGARLEQLQLLVLSCGHGWPDCSMDGGKETVTNFLAENFLTAGASCVVSQLWNVPDVVKELFFYHFYNSLQTGSKISQAIAVAKNAVREKHRDPVYWSGFVALGNDVTVDLSEIRKSQLHASLDLAGSDDLNLKSVVEDAVTPEVALDKLQAHFSRLSGYLPAKSSNRDVIGALIEVLEESMDRLTADSNTDRSIVLLHELLAQAKGAVGLLEELGFDFQSADVPIPPSNTSDPSPFTPSQEVTVVVFPHWNKDGMLLPTHQALTGLQDVCSSDVALQCLARILPLKQAVLCSLIDLLAVTRHTPDVQLRVQDDGVQALWSDRYIRQYLLEIGFMQIHDLVIFYKTSTNRTLLIASLQVFASLCLHRDQSVLERLNVSSLGQPPKESKTVERKELKTVTPLILPRKEVILLSSWMKDQHPGDEEERGVKRLAQRLQQAKDEYERMVNHAKWWHKNLLQPQAQMKLSDIGMEKGPKPLKRKVKPGATPSFQRESVNGTPDPHDRQPFFQTFAAAMRKRDYANYLVQKRCDELESRYKSKVHGIYRQYAVNG